MPPGWTIRRAKARNWLWRAEARHWRWHGAAFAGYALLGAAFIDHGESLTGRIAGQGADPFAFIWFLQWWPWAIGHGIDPLYTPLVWQPAGVYLDWVTSVPLLGLAGWPLTAISPVLTYNFFILLGPVLAACTAYLLCLHISRMPAAALIGGFLFGFSSYEMGQDSAALNLSFTMFVPMLLLIILLRLDGVIGRFGTLLLAGLALICQFLLCIEIFGLVFVFGGICWAFAMVYLPARRAALRRLVVDGLATALPVVAVLAPVLISMARHADTINLPSAWPYYYTGDLLNFFIPTRMNLFGGGWFSRISSHFNGGIQEQGSYLGVPLLVMILLFAWEQRAAPAARLLVVMFLLLAVLSLGPRLWIAGHYSGVALPWTLFVHLPLVKSALPCRFALFASLAAAMIAALWIARPVDGSPAAQRNLRLGLGGLACLALLPSPHPWMTSPVAKFFQPGRAELALGAQARVLVLPFAINGPAMFWQAENRFGFAQTGGYLGFPPKPMQNFPAVYQLFGGTETPGFLGDFAKFCAATHTQFVAVGPGTSVKLEADIARLGWPAKTTDDVTLYTVPAAGNPLHG